MLNLRKEETIIWMLQLTHKMIHSEKSRCVVTMHGHYTDS